MTAADPTTLTELASATEAQLRAVVDPDAVTAADFSAAEAAGLVRQKWVGAAGEYDFRRTAKGERWYAALREMADGLSDAQVDDMHHALGRERRYRNYYAATVGDIAHVQWMFLAAKGLATSSGISNGGHDTILTVTDLGRAVLSLRLREQEGACR